MKIARTVVTGLVAGVALVALTACAGGGEESQPEEQAGPPPIAGVSDQQVQSELDGLSCASSRDILASPGMTEDVYFGPMADYASGQGGSAREWRAAIDWWWQTTCGGM